MLVVVEITALVVIVMRDEAVRGQVVIGLWPRDAFLPQRALEEQLTDDAQDAEHERRQGQDAGEPLHRLDEAGQGLLQTWEKVAWSKLSHNKCTHMQPDTPTHLGISERSSIPKKPFSAQENPQRAEGI